MRSLRNYIDGEWRDARDGRVVQIVDPANGAPLWTAALSSAADVSEALTAAARSFPLWRRASARTRAGALAGASRAIHEDGAAIAGDIASENGKTRDEALREVESTVSTLAYWAAQATEPTGEVLPRSDTAARIWAERVPIGPIACITPWNFPLLIPAYKVGAALAYGNTVVVKPASLTPASAVHLAGAFASCRLPAGVMNIVLGEGGSLSEGLFADPRTRGVSFTGSNEVGRAIAARAAATGVRMQLEMGGKNPVIVLDDADLERAARVTVEGAMGMAGQRCTATSRAIVLAEVADPFAALVESRIAEIRLGHPLTAGTKMGPLISAEQRRKVLSAIAGARATGARLRHGGVAGQGRDLERGHFVEPTLFDEVDPASPLAQEEIFGPVLAIIRVTTIDEAVAVANATRYGLAASVWTRDLGRALRLVDDLDFGVVHVNGQTPAIERYVPFGGTKSSGYGAREQGHGAREFFTEWKSVYLSGPET